MPQPVHRHPTSDGDGLGMQKLGDPWPDERCAEQDAVVEIDHETRLSGVAICVEICAGHHIADVDVDRLDAKSQLPSGIGGQANRSGLGIGENACGTALLSAVVT